MIFLWIFNFGSTIAYYLIGLLPDATAAQNAFSPNVQSAITFFGNLLSWVSFWFPVNTLFAVIKFEILFRLLIFAYRALRDVISVLSGGVIKK